MKWIVFTLIFFVSFFLVAVAVADEEQRLLYPMVEQHVEKKLIRVAKGFVVIDWQSRTLFIDYAGGLLHNYSKKTDRCQRFNLLQPEPRDAFIAEQTKVFGEMSIIEDGAKSKNRNGLPSYRVLYAPRAMRARTVAVVSTKQFGITFLPKIAEFAVRPDHVDYRQLRDIAEYNSKNSESNPLILQLDLTQLIALLGGVPVRQIEGEAVTKLVFSIEKESTLRNLRPSQCEGL